MNDSPLEIVECTIFAHWLSERGYMFSHLAQSTWTSSWNARRRNTLMGVSPGIPDYIIVVNRHIVFIEMKRKKGGEVSLEQKKWIRHLSSCDNVEAMVCRGADEAIAFIEEIERIDHPEAPVRKEVIKKISNNLKRARKNGDSKSWTRRSYLRDLKLSARVEGEIDD